LGCFNRLGIHNINKEVFYEQEIQIVFCQFIVLCRGV
jgi:hypothetical protein